MSPWTMLMHSRNTIALTDVTFHVCNGDAACYGYSFSLPSAGSPSQPFAN